MPSRFTKERTFGFRECILALRHRLAERANQQSPVFKQQKRNGLKVPLYETALTVTELDTQERTK